MSTAFLAQQNTPLQKFDGAIYYEYRGTESITEWLEQFELVAGGATQLSL